MWKICTHVVDAAEIFPKRDMNAAKADRGNDGWSGMYFIVSGI